MVLKGYVKKVAELKKKTKEQLINSIIEKERRRDDKLSNLVNQYITYRDLLEKSRNTNKELEKIIVELKSKSHEKQKQIDQLIGFLKMREDDLRKATKEINNQSKKITNIVLQKFNEIKIKIIQELVSEKVQLIQENLEKRKDEEIIDIFATLGVPREKVMEILRNKG